MKRLILFLFLILFCTGVIHSQSTDVFKYRLYDDLKDEDITVLKNKLNDNVGRIMGDLGLDIGKAGTFTVHIWHNRENFLTTMEQKLGKRYPQSNGYAMGYSEIAVMYVDRPQTMIDMSGLLYCFTLEEIAEHEFVHCLSMRLNSRFPNNPRWLWESFAMYESNENYDPATLSYLKAANYPSLNELDTDFNVGNYKIYQVGFLIGEFIITKWGRSKLIELVKSLGDISKVLNISTTKFEMSWKQFVDQKYFNNTFSPGNELIFPMVYQKSNSLIFFFNNDQFLGGTIQLFDLNGRLISSGLILNNSVSFDLNSCMNGIYVASIRNGKLSFSRKISVRK
jgi:hypothetical protein